MYTKTSNMDESSKKFIESMLTDLRNLSNDAKKKYPNVREAAETGLTKFRNIASSNSSGGGGTMTCVRQASTELVHPFLMGCTTKQPKLVQCSLVAIQRMISHSAIDSKSAGVVVNELWSLVEQECEELRVLQTLTLLVVTNNGHKVSSSAASGSSAPLVCGQALSKCLVMCFRLNFAKDPVVINTASASVRQLVAAVMDRVVEEDKRSDQHISGSNNTQPDRTNAPAATDAYCLFRDICHLINAEQPEWLIGISEMTRTLGLELLESMLTNYVAVFMTHSEFAYLLKEQVCPLVIKLFSPNLKFVQVVSQHSGNVKGSGDPTGGVSPTADRPYFPITMRLLRVVCVLLTNYDQLLVTECEIFLSLVLKFLDGDKLNWQNALSLEVISRIVTKPHLLSRFCENYDCKSHSANVMQSIVNGLSHFVQASFFSSDNLTGTSPTSDNDHSSNFSSVGQPGFLYRGVWIPLCFISTQGAAKSFLLELLDKHEAPGLPEGYCLSLAYTGILEIGYSVQLIIQNEAKLVDGDKTVPAVGRQLFLSSYCGVLSAVSLLLDASVDELVTETLLKAMSSLVYLASSQMAITTLSGTDEERAPRDAALAAICKAALPPNYIGRVFNADNSDMARGGSPLKYSSYEANDVHASQVVAVGTPCPTPANIPQSGTNVMLTAKNLQAVRILINTGQLNGASLEESWHLLLATVQHVVWILGLKPALSGGLSVGEGPGDVGGNASAGTVLTTAVMADIPVIASMLNKLFENTISLDDVSLHHVMAALCKLSNEAMQVAGNHQREPSFFPVAKLVQMGAANLHRFDVLWKPLTAHLLEICFHPFTKLREWGASSLMLLVKDAFASEDTAVKDAKRQQLIFNPLERICDVSHGDVRSRQLDCLMHLLLTQAQRIDTQLWPTVLKIVGDVVGGQFTFSEMLIKQGYQAVKLLTTDFLQILSLSCVRQLIEVVAQYSAQQSEINISLSAVGQLWTISDFLNRRGRQQPPSSGDSGAEVEPLWLVLYGCLSELCVDARPSVRKSSCQTLLQTVATHGAVLSSDAWHNMIWKILFPMLDKVAALSASASTQKMTDATGDGGNDKAMQHKQHTASILIHHSRDTQSKQWAETSVQTLAGVVKIFNAQRHALATLPDFARAWSVLLEHIEPAALSENPEVSLAALKTLQELLGRDKSAVDAAEKGESVTETANPTPLDPEYWLVAWKVWLRITTFLTSERPRSVEQRATASSVVTKEPTSSVPPLPGPHHLTTLVSIFPSLFDQVKRYIEVDELLMLIGCLKGVTVIPISADLAPFILPTSTNVTPTQQAVLDCARSIYAEVTLSDCRLRPALAQLLRLLLDVVAYACKAPPAVRSTTRAAIHAQKTSVDPADWVAQNYVPFAEISLRLVVEYYGNTAHFEEVIQASILADIVKSFGTSMALKYSCPSQSTWKLAVASLITVLRLGLPIARQHLKYSRSLWTELADTFEKFLFSRSEPTVPLNFEERRRHEFIDIQLIDLIRMEILPHVALLPRDFVTRIIELLNQGSISGGADSKDVVGVETHSRRVELSKACFDALLSMSRSEPDVVRCTSPLPAVAATPSSVIANEMGTGAIHSLISRCRQVVTSFVDDERMSASLPLPGQRITEMTSVLKGVTTLIDGLKRRPQPVKGDMWQEVIDLYPMLVDCIQCRDKNVQAVLVETLKSYSALLKPI